MPTSLIPPANLALTPQADRGIQARDPRPPSTSVDSSNDLPRIPGNLATGPSGVTSVRLPAPKNNKSNGVTVRSSASPPVLPVLSAPPRNQTVDADKIVERQLEKLSYYPSDPIVTNTPTGPVVHFLKSYNRKGQIVYIILDVDGVVSVPENAPIFDEVKVPSMIPISLKKGSYECAGFEVSGVAFECRNGLSTFIREDNHNLEERDFIFNNDPLSDESNLIFMEESSRPYPMVKLSELFTDPNLVDEFVDGATRRLQNSTYLKNSEDLRDLEEKVTELQNQFSYYKITQDKILKDIAYRIRTLELDPELNSKSLQDYEDKLNQIIKISSQISELRPALATSIERIRGANDYLKSQFK